MYETGNIDDWDITLMCKVLLYSRVTKEKLDQEEAYQGYKDAIIGIKEKKNKMLSHNSSFSITKHVYNKSIEALRGYVLKLGFNIQLFEDTLKGTFSRFFHLYRQKDMIKKE